MTHKTKLGKCLLQTSTMSFRNTYLGTYNNHVELNFLHSCFYGVELYLTDMLPRVQDDVFHWHSLRKSPAVSYLRLYVLKLLHFWLALYLFYHHELLEKMKCRRMVVFVFDHLQMNLSHFIHHSCSVDNAQMSFC